MGFGRQRRGLSESGRKAYPLSLSIALDVPSATPLVPPAVNSRIAPYTNSRGARYGRCVAVCPWRLSRASLRVTVLLLVIDVPSFGTVELARSQQAASTSQQYTGIASDFKGRANAGRRLARAQRNERSVRGATCP